MKRRRDQNAGPTNHNLSQIGHRSNPTEIEQNGSRISSCQCAVKLASSWFKHVYTLTDFVRLLLARKPDTIGIDIDAFLLGPVHPTLQRIVNTQSVETIKFSSSDIEKFKKVLSTVVLGFHSDPAAWNMLPMPELVTFVQRSLYAASPLLSTNRNPNDANSVQHQSTMNIATLMKIQEELVQAAIDKSISRHGGGSKNKDALLAGYRRPQVPWDPKTSNQTRLESSTSSMTILTSVEWLMVLYILGKEVMRLLLSHSSILIFYPWANKQEQEKEQVQPDAKRRKMMGNSVQPGHYCHPVFLQITGSPPSVYRHQETGITTKAHQAKLDRVEKMRQERQSTAETRKYTPPRCVIKKRVVTYASTITGNVRCSLPAVSVAIFGKKTLCSKRAATKITAQILSLSTHKSISVERTGSKVVAARSGVGTVKGVRHIPATKKDVAIIHLGKRLKPMASLVYRILSNSFECRPKQIMNRHCPLSTEILAIMKHFSTNVKHGPLVPGFGHDSLDVQYKSKGSEEFQALHPASLEPLPVSSALSASRIPWTPREFIRYAELALTKLVSSAASVSSVSKVVYSLIRNIIPFCFLGCLENWILFSKLVHKFIHLRMDETMDLSIKALDFSIRPISWLWRMNSKDGKVVNPEDLVWRQKHFYRMLCWVFRKVVAPLIRSLFYVTECELLRGRSIYFRKDVWHAIEYLGISLMKHKQQLGSGSEAKSVLQSFLHQDAARRFSILMCRILPKSDTIRIFQCPLDLKTGKRLSKKAMSRSFNPTDRALYNSSIDVLKDAKAVLDFERQRRFDGTRATSRVVIAISEIYEWLRALKDSWNIAGRPSLYCCAFDISKAFDCVDRTKLFNKVLNDIFMNEEYWICRYQAMKTYSGGRRFPVEHRVVVSSPMELTDFRNFVEKSLVGEVQNTIVLNTGHLYTMTKSRLIQDLKDWFAEHVIRIGTKVYHQNVGIPQGNLASSLLASLYLSHMEMHSLQAFFTPRVSWGTIRLVDDFFMVQKSSFSVEELLTRLEHGVDDYGMKISVAKTKINFEMRSDFLPEIPTRRFIPWCGLLIDTRHLTVSTDWARYVPVRLSDTMAVDESLDLWSTLQSRVTGLFATRLPPILFDSKMNGKPKCTINAYEKAVLIFMKIYCMLDLMECKGLLLTRTKGKVVDIASLFHKARHEFRNKLFRVMDGIAARQLNAIFEITKVEVDCIVLMAWRDVCDRYGKRDWIAGIDTELALAKFDKCKEWIRNSIAQRDDEYLFRVRL